MKAAGTRRQFGMPVQKTGNFETFLFRIQSPALLVVARLWDEARGTKRMPSWVDILSLRRLPDDARLWGFACDRKTGEFTGRLAGRRYRKWVGDDFYGRRLKDIQLPANYAQSQPLRTKIVTTPLAARSSGRLFTIDDYVVTGERIALPLAEDGQTGDGILGASDYWPPPLLGTPILVHENVEWYSI